MATSGDVTSGPAFGAPLADALDALPVPFVIFGPDERIVLCNREYRTYYHPAEEEVGPGTSFEELQWIKVRHGIDRRATGRAEAYVAAALDDFRNGPGVVEWQADDGRHYRYLRARFGDGWQAGMRFDTTDLRQAQAALEAQTAALEAARATEHRLARTDALTGFLNRRAAEQEMERLARECRASGRALALLHIDLDGFKQINDTLGHAAGDHILSVVAARIRASVPAGAAIARIGGDEFLVALSVPIGCEAPRDVAEGIVAAMARPAEFDGRPCFFGASVGIALGLGADLDPDGVLKAADAALYRSKADGRNRCTVFDAAMNREVEDRARLGQEFLAAADGSQLEALFQPILDARDRRVVAAEALVRWRHPRLGLLEPERFLGVAEELKMIPDLDRAILGQVARLRADLAGTPLPRIAVNVSGGTLSDPGLLATLRALDLGPGALSLEITESRFADGEIAALRFNLDGLREMGVDLTLDDFGRGEASISSVMMLRPRHLKIGRAFATRIARDPEAREIVRLTVAMARTLDVAVTASGVETEEQATILAGLGCARLQGYLFAAPMSEAAFAGWARDAGPGAGQAPGAVGTRRA